MCSAPLTEKDFFPPWSGINIKDLLFFILLFFFFDADVKSTHKMKTETTWQFVDKSNKSNVIHKYPTWLSNRSTVLSLKTNLIFMLINRSLTSNSTTERNGNSVKTTRGKMGTRA